MKLPSYIGVLLGALYGLCYRLLCENGRFDSVSDIYRALDGYNIYSITFIWILPIIIGLIPILFAKDSLLNSKWKQFLLPLSSVLLFFLLALSSGLEDWLCIIIIAFPFLISAGLVGLILGTIILRIKSKKIYSILLLPFILNPLETYLPIENQYYTVNSEIIINADRATVWGNLIEVPEIESSEYNYGLYNYLGVPRPIKSELLIINSQTYRIGYFTEGLKLCETISQKDSLRFVNFKIHLDKSELRDTPTDKHLLNSDYFKFENISYTLLKLSEEKTKLSLNCEYTLNSKMNTYANFWAQNIIHDFESKLLEVLKHKIEKTKQNKS